MSGHKGNGVRQELLRTISRLSERWPSLRVAQLVGNAIPPEEAKRRNNDLYYVENEQLLQWLLDYERTIDHQRQAQQG